MPASAAAATDRMRHAPQSVNSVDLMSHRAPFSADERPENPWAGHAVHPGAHSPWGRMLSYAAGVTGRSGDPACNVGNPGDTCRTLGLLRTGRKPGTPLLCQISKRVEVAASLRRLSAISRQSTTNCYQVIRSWRPQAVAGFRSGLDSSAGKPTGRAPGPASSSRAPMG